MAVRMALTQMYGAPQSANLGRPWFAATGVFDTCPRAFLAGPEYPVRPRFPDPSEVVAR